MTTQELERQLEDDAQSRHQGGVIEGYGWGAWFESDDGATGLFLIRKEFEGPYSCYTPVQVPEDWGDQWRGLTELREIEWRRVYRVVIAEYAPRPSLSDEEWLAYPRNAELLRCQMLTERTLEEVGQLLVERDKSLSDIVAFDESWNLPEQYG